jgi:hypothetical protein
MLIHRIKVPMGAVIRQTIIKLAQEQPKYQFILDRVSLNESTQDMTIDIRQEELTPKDNECHQ